MLKNITTATTCLMLTIMLAFIAGCTKQSAIAFTNTLGMQFIAIPAGSFIMGSPETEAERTGNETQRRVTLSSYLLGETEVTQAQWIAVMNTNPSMFPNGSEASFRPVDKISWFDAIIFCNKLSVLEGRTPVYSIGDSTNPDMWGDVPTSLNATQKEVIWNREANGYRLPTEAEWEYAARAGTKTPFATGKNITTDQANYYGHYPYNNNPAGEWRKTTLPAGSLFRNAWGLADMHGNVLEWCWDWYAEYPAEDQTDPTGPATGQDRIQRGGSWNNFGRHQRSAYRNFQSPYYRSHYDSFGLRLVLPAQL